MNEEEIGRLVVTMLGNVTPYIGAMKEADAATKMTQNSLRAAGIDVEGFGHSFSHLGHAVTEALGIIGLGLETWRSFHHFSEMEQAEVKLTAAIQARGGAIGETLTKYREFAEETEKGTVVSRVAALGLLRQAEMYELSGNRAEDAAKKAMQLAAAVDGTAASGASYIRIAAALEKGDTQRAMMMSRIVPQLRGVRNETEFLEKATKLLAAGEMQMSAEATTAHGRLTQLGNQFHVVQENIGAVVAEAVMPFVTLLSSLARSLGEVDPQVIRIILSLVGMVAAVKIIITAGTSLIGVLSAVYKGLEMLGALMATDPLMALGIITMVAAAAALAYIFSNELGPKVKSFADEMERAARASNYVAKTFGGFAEEGIQRIRGMPQGRQEDALKANIKMLEEQVKSGRDALAARRDNDSGLGKFFAGIFTPSAVKARGESIAADQARLDAMSKALLKYRTELSSLTSSGLGPELTKMLEDQTEKLFMQYKTFGKTAEEAERYKLILSGVPEGKLGNYDLLSKLIEGQKITEQYETKQEKMAKQLAKVQDLFFAGAISAQTYDRALQQLVNTTNDLGGAQGHLLGSASSIELQQKYDQMIANMNRPTPEANRPPLLELKETNTILGKIEKNTSEALKKKAREGLSAVGAEELQ